MDVRAVISTVDELVVQGRELSQMASDFTWYLRNLLLVKSSDDMEDVLDVSTENLARLKEEAQMVDDETLMRFIRIFSDLSNQLKFAVQKRVLLEVTLIKLCRPAMDQNIDALTDRVRALEKQAEEGVFQTKVMAAPSQVERENKVPAKKAVLEKALPEEIKVIAKEYRSLIGSEQLPVPLRRLLVKSSISIDDNNHLVIYFEDSTIAKAVNKSEHIQMLKDVIADRIGKNVEIVIRTVEKGRNPDEQYVNLEKMINFDITEED